MLFFRHFFLYDFFPPCWQVSFSGNAVHSTLIVTQRIDNKIIYYNSSNRDHAVHTVRIGTLITNFSSSKEKQTAKKNTSAHKRRISYKKMHMLEQKSMQNIDWWKVFARHAIFRNFHIFCSVFCVVQTFDYPNIKQNLMNARIKYKIILLVTLTEAFYIILTWLHWNSQRFMWNYAAYFWFFFSLHFIQIQNNCQEFTCADITSDQIGMKSRLPIPTKTNRSKYLFWDRFHLLT